MNAIIIFAIMIILVIIVYKSAKSSPYLFKAILKGSNETPPNKSTSIGTATLVLNKDTKVAVLIVNYSIALKPISAHIHKGEPGVAGPIIFPLDHTKNPIRFVSAPLTSAQESDLKAGLYYVNIHTEEFPGGEIRGQLIY